MILLLIQAVLVFVAAALGQSLGLWIVLWPFRRSPADAHWTERARLSWGARLLNVFGPMGAATLIGVTAQRLAPHPHAAWVLGTATFLGATLGVVHPARQYMRRRLTWFGILGEYFVTFVILRPGFLVLIGMAILLVGRDLDAVSISIMTGAFVLVLALQFGAAIPVARLGRVLTEASPRLRLIVADVGERAGMKMPRVFLLHWNAANAFAFIYANALAFTPACVDLMTDAELRSVAAHELAHLRESFAQKLTRTSGLLLFFPYFTSPVWVARYGAGGFLVAALIVLIGARLLRGFSQRMERRADEAAHASAEGEGTYARALEKLYEYNMSPAVMRGKRQSHPHLYDRLLAAGVEPAYPRPKAPSLLLLLPALAIVLAMSESPRLLHLRHRFDAAQRTHVKGK